MAYVRWHRVRPRTRLAAIAALACLAVAGPVRAASPPIDPLAPFTPRVSGLVAQMTLDEKVSLMHGLFAFLPNTDPAPLGQAGYTPGVPRLGIPARRDADALGVNVNRETTAPPTRIGIGASFDRGSATDLGALEGTEGRAVGVDLVYGPQLDLARIPGASRNQTTAGEDPFLTGELGVAEIDAIQSQGLMSQAKHFALYNQSTSTGGSGATLNVTADEQTLREMYAWPFEAAVKDGLVSSIMCSYQKSYGRYTCEQPLLLNGLLRAQWGFKGFVTSDYGAAHSPSVVEGLDQEFITNQFDDAFERAVLDGSFPLASVDTAVARILYEYERFGLLDATPRPRPQLDKAAGIAVAERLAERSAVLLRNEARQLPLRTRDLRSAAVIGPTARQLFVGVGGERSRGFADRDAISPLQALRSLAPDGSSISYAPGVDWLGTVVPESALGAGLTRTQDTSGETRVDRTLDYTSADGLAPGATYTWTGTLTAPADDTYYLQLQRSATDPTAANPAGIGTVTLTVDGTQQTLANPVPSGPVPVITTPDGLYNVGARLQLSAGEHSVRVTYAVPASASAPAALRLTWSALSRTLAAAADAARSARVAVAFANDQPGGNATPDRDPATLAADQDAMIATVADENPNTVVVLNTGSPVLMPWVDDVRAILAMWYPGQEGGTATARVLLGRSVPGGKLPMTFPASREDTPFAGHPERFPGVDDEETYSEGIFFGYRWYDRERIEPLFPFGFGLSYSRFRYSGLSVDRAADGGLDVSFGVRNTGNRTGDEAPQVYVGPASGVPAGIQQAVRQLVQFTRLRVAPGQPREVTVHVRPRALSYWSPSTRRWVVGTGTRQISVGASSRDIRLRGQVDVTGAQAQPSSSALR